MKPYYQDASCTIFHGRAEVIVPSIEPAMFDLLLTDPPYGIGEARARNKTRSVKAVSRDYGDAAWDDRAPPRWVLDMLRARATHSIIFGGNYFDLPPSSCWLVWDKDNGENDFADCELAWTNLPKAVRRLKYRWQGMLQEKQGAERETRWHPTQKPIDVIRWAMSHAPAEVATILDPFMGSGTTLRAAKDAGKRCVGIDAEERYCEIAAKRLAQEVLPLGVAG